MYTKVSLKIIFTQMKLENVKIGVTTRCCAMVMFSHTHSDLLTSVTFSSVLDRVCEILDRL